MKITIEIDCTPEEARKLAGLPDVEPLQQEIMALLKERMTKAMSLTDPETLMRTWIPMTQNLGAQGVEALQNMIKLVQTRARGGDGPKSKPK